MKIPSKAQTSIILAKAQRAWATLNTKHNLIVEAFLVSALSWRSHCLQLCSRFSCYFHQQFFPLRGWLMQQINSGACFICLMTHKQVANCNYIPPLILTQNMQILGLVTVPAAQAHQGRTGQRYRWSSPDETGELRSRFSCFVTQPKWVACAS